MPKPCVFQKQELVKLVESGEILVGEKVVETEYTRFKVDKVTNCVVRSNCKLAAQKIRLIDTSGKGCWQDMKVWSLLETNQMNTMSNYQASR